MISNKKERSCLPMVIPGFECECLRCLLAALPLRETYERFVLLIYHLSIDWQWSRARRRGGGGGGGGDGFFASGGRCRLACFGKNEWTWNLKQILNITQRSIGNSSGHHLNRGHSIDFEGQNSCQFATLIENLAMYCTKERSITIVLNDW